MHMANATSGTSADTSTQSTLETATINWTYIPRPAGYNTPYGIYPFWHFGSHSIADGKLFLSESRMYDPPIFSDAHKVAINCTDGSVVWNITGLLWP